MTDCHPLLFGHKYCHPFLSARSCLLLLFVCLRFVAPHTRFFASSYPLSNSSRMSLYFSHRNFSGHFNLASSFLFFNRSFLWLSASSAFCSSPVFMFEKEKMSVLKLRAFFVYNVFPLIAFHFGRNFYTQFWIT